MSCRICDGTGFVHYDEQRIQTCQECKCNGAPTIVMDRLMGPEVKTPRQLLSEQMQQDSDLAWVWHCYFACAGIEAGLLHKVANEMAANLMRTVFDVNTFTRMSAEFKDLWDA